MNKCPFCGSEDVGPGYKKHPFGHEIVSISCCNCGAAGPAFVYPPPEHEDQADLVEQQAENGWNRRA